jgi:hypothetical protein
MKMVKKITKKVAKQLGEKYNIDFKVVPFNEYLIGLNNELEHGTKFGKMTNISNDNLDITAKIVLAHLLEDPRYYYYLEKMEIKREKYWSIHKKPSIFI